MVARDAKPSRNNGKKKRQEQELRRTQLAEGLAARTPPAMPNACSALVTVAEEKEERMEAVTEQMRVFRAQLPKLLLQLKRIPNPRNPRKCKHKLTVLLLYGILMFLFQFGSRREVNREMTRPQFEANLHLLFPELETLPHADTLYRLLRDIDVSHIEEAHLALIHRLVRGKTFQRYLINNCYPIAIDGSQLLLWVGCGMKIPCNVPMGREKTAQHSTTSTFRSPASPSATE